MRRLWLAVLFCCLSNLVGCSFAPKVHYPAQACYEAQCYTIELATTLEQRIRGLQGRRTLPNNHGMLFVFENPAREMFWMKDTLIPLDMIWMDQDGKVIYIETNVPPCKTDTCPSYGPDQSAKYVLELNALEVKRMGLTLGNKINIF